MQGTIAKNLLEIGGRIAKAIETSSYTKNVKVYYMQVSLLAVSKTKPNEILMEAYKAGQIHFGENYVEELVRKSKEVMKLYKIDANRY